MAVTKKTPAKTPKIEVINIQLSTIDRTYKGIPEWRNAIIAAESIYHPRRIRLYDLYEEVKLDMHLSALLDKRRSKVTNTTIKFFNADGKENDVINNLIETERFEDMIKDIIDSKFEGHSLLWFNSIADKIDYKLIPRKHVRPETHQVISQVYDETGIDYLEKPYANYVLEAGKPNDLGLLAKAAVGVIYKKGDVADWSVFAQIFGTPFREYIYDDPSTKKQLEEVAKLTESASFVVRPTNAEFKIHDTGNKTGSSDLYSVLAKFCDDQMSKLILLNTMTTDAQGGNYKGEVHAESEEAVTKADKRFVLRILNEKFKHILQNFGYAVEGGWFGYEDQEEMSLKEQLEFDLKFHEKAPLDEDYWYETYNRPRPKKESLKSEVMKPEGEGKDGDDDPPKPKMKKQDLNDKTSWAKQLRDFFFRHPVNLHDELNLLYYDHACHSGCNHEPLNLSDDLFSSQQLIHNALANIFTDERYRVGNKVEPNLWQQTYKQLNQAVDEGFGKAVYNSADFDFLNELKTNNGVFAAFKAHAAQTKMAGQLLTPDGKLKNWAQFNKDTKALIETNQRHLKTEYVTAVQRARSAEQFRGFQKTAHLYPNITWTPSRAAVPDKIHIGYYGTTLPINDPFWAANYPGNRWNCKCGWEQSDGDVSGYPADIIKPQPGLDENPAISKAIFSKTHPARTIVKKAAAKSIEQQAKALVKQDAWQTLRQWRDASIDERDGLLVKSSRLLTGELKIIRRSIKTINQHTADLSVKQYIPFMSGDVDNWEYIGYALTAPDKHLESDCFLYYKTKIGGKTKYLNIMLHKDLNTEVPYAIINDIDMSRVIQGDPPMLDKYQKK